MNNQKTTNDASAHNQVQQIVMLKLRNEIAKKEALTACANNDLATYGQWQCDWAEGFSETDKKIKELILELEA